MAGGLDSGSSPATQLLRALGRSPKLCEPQLLTSKVTVTHRGEMLVQVSIHALVPVFFLIFIEFVVILLLFYILVFWSQGKWDLGSLTRDQTLTPFPALEGKGLTAGLPGKSHSTLNSEYHLLCARPRSGHQKNSSRQSGENSLPSWSLHSSEGGGR